MSEASCRQVPPSVLEKLKMFDSPTVSNVIELYDVRQRNAGFVNSRIKAIFPDQPAIVGYATTATYRTSHAPARGDLTTTMIEHVEAMSQLPEPRIVVFEDPDDPPFAANFGEVMCSIYKKFGCVGIITSGAARDLEALKRMGMAVFASSVCVSHGFGRIEAVHRPVHVGGLTVRPGDLIHADANGIVAIPVDIAADVAEACPRFVQAEGIVLKYLERPDFSLEGLRGALGELFQEIAKMRGSASHTEMV